MKLGVLFSGGKDSVFACRLAMERDEVACLITIVSKNPDSYMFHTPNIRRTDIQAQAMDIPILVWPTEGREEEELSDLAAAISAARDRYGIEGVVTGAIESVYQAARVQRICRDQGLWCCSPLWQTNQIDYLRLLLKEGFLVIISGVYAYPFDESWLGAPLTEELIQKLESLQKRYKINPSGEGGELETFVLDGPIFHKRIEILKASKVYANYRGRLIIEELRLAEKTGQKCILGQSVLRSGISVSDIPLHEPARQGEGCILLVDLSFARDSLFKLEFVHPIRDALKDLGHCSDILHYSEVTPRDLASHDKVILCGTALKDDGYARSLQSFAWVKNFEKPLLGICAGMQVISAVYDGSIVSSPAIGLKEIEILQNSPLLGEPRIIEGYHLHNSSATLPEGFLLLAGRSNSAEAFRHPTRPTFAVIFHPEVRNRWILERFVNLSQSH
ncbi:MAG: diphthine--ammonia ligase [Methanothrix sp.]